MRGINKTLRIMIVCVIITISSSMNAQSILIGDKKIDDTSFYTKQNIISILGEPNKYSASEDDFENYSYDGLGMSFYNKQLIEYDVNSSIYRVEIGDKILCVNDDFNIIYSLPDFTIEKQDDIFILMDINKEYTFFVKVDNSKIKGISYSMRL